MLLRLCWSEQQTQDSHLSPAGPLTSLDATETLQLIQRHFKAHSGTAVSRPSFRAGFASTRKAEVKVRKETLSICFHCCIEKPL